MIRRAHPERLREESSGERVGPRGTRAGLPGLLHTLALLAWGILVLAASVVLAAETGLWWLVLLFGAAVPVALATQGKGDARTRPPSAWAKDGERELLDVLGRHGEVGPALVAMETMLTVTEADEMLGEMARKGHLEVRVRDGVLAYALPGRRSEAPSSGSAADPTVPGGATGGAGHGAPSPDRGPAGPLADPLTERELEVLKLLASGRTNKEIAADLFVSLGTVKAHTASIYRKLGARHRAEALARARDLNL